MGPGLRELLARRVRLVPLDPRVIPGLPALPVRLALLGWREPPDPRVIRVLLARLVLLVPIRITFCGLVLRLRMTLSPRRTLRRSITSLRSSCGFEHWFVAYDGCKGWLYADQQGVCGIAADLACVGTTR